MAKYTINVSHYKTGKRIVFDPRKNFQSKKTAKKFIDFVKRTTAKENLKFFKNPRIQKK